MRRALLLALLVGGSGCDQTAPPSAQAAAQAPGAERRGTLGREPLEPLPDAPRAGPLEALGQKLFHEKRLSSTGNVSCASCHDLERGGDDGRKISIGVDGRTGTINAPTVYNASLNIALFWDGRAETLEAQIDGPLTSPIELNTKWDDLLARLRSDPEYVAAFQSLFPDGINSDNVRGAIAAFERTLLTTGSAFDRWVRGEAGALSAEEQAGYELFKSVGCIACHQGRNVGGNMFQKFGVLFDYFEDKGQLSEADYGRFNVTKNESDRFVFRVPSLRNVAYTAPYFHDGSAATLEQAVQVMAKYQLGRKLTDEQVLKLVAFLKSLSGPRAHSAPGG